MTDGQKVGWVGRHDFGWGGRHYMAVRADGTIVGGFYATEDDARAALAAAQAGAPTRAETDDKMAYVATGWKQGFAAGIEHIEALRKKVLVRYHAVEKRSQARAELGIVLDFIAAIRTLWPPAAPVESEVMPPVQTHTQTETQPLSASEPAGAPSEEDVIRAVAGASCGTSYTEARNIALAVLALLRRQSK